MPKRQKPLRIVNFISGTGSTNAAILKAEKPGGKLYGLVETVAIIASTPKAAGIQRAIDLGFPAEHIFVVSPKQANFIQQLLKYLNRYQPDYFHQLGWIPLTPLKVIKKYQGLNQHLGPGGKWMYGLRRIYAHIRFCEIIGQSRPIPIFCQKVAPRYDAGDVICLKKESILPGETVDEAAERLVKIEHNVQIEALYSLATNTYRTKPVPRIARNSTEEELLEQVKREANDYYTRQIKFS